MTSPARAVRSAPRRPATPAPGARASRPSLRVVPTPARRARTGLVIAFSAIVVFGALVVSAVAHSYLVSGQAELDEMATELRVQREALEADLVQLAANQSPQRIAEEARLLGMVPAETQTWISPGTGSAPVVVGGEGAEHPPPSSGDDPPPAIPDRSSSSSELASAPPSGRTHP